MKTRHPAFWRYTAFQIPGWLLAAIGGWWVYTTLDVPLWIASGVLVVWVVKDYALYPILRFAYEADHRRPIEHLIGTDGTAVESLDPTGYVRVRGELWNARREGEIQDRDGQAPVDKDCSVKVTGVDGTTLVVRRRSDTTRRSAGAPPPATPSR